MAAERRLLEKPRGKLVVLHFVHVLLPQSTFAGEAVPDPGRVGVVQVMVSHAATRNHSRRGAARNAVCEVRGS